MPVYFFTQSHLLNAHATSQPFGPVAGDLEKKYRVCTLNTFSNDAKAFSVAKGEVKAQPVAGSTTLINLVLKPENPSFVQGLRIKYFIYRGIKKSSLINGTIIAASATNDLTTYIWAQHQNMVTTTAGTPNAITGDPSQDILGMNLVTLPDADPIENLFAGNPTMVVPTIEAGKHMGLFDKTRGGLEIVMEGYFLDDTMASIRSLDHIIDAGTFANTFANKSIREKVTNYLDPSAFYGFVPNAELEVLESTGVVAHPSKIDFFLQVLYAKFPNHDLLYIDIRSQSDISHVYLSANYDYKIFDLIFLSITPVTADYAVNKWPVFAVRPAASNFITWPGDLAQLNFGFQKEPYEVKPILYCYTPVKTSHTASGRSLSFITDAQKYTNGTTFLTIASDRIGISGVNFYLNKFPSDGTIDSMIISNYLRIKYFKLVDPAVTGSSSAIFPRPLTDVDTIRNNWKKPDNLFICKPYPAGPAIPPNKTLIIRTGDSYLNFPIDSRRYVAGIYETYIAFENDRVTTFALLSDVHEFSAEFVEPLAIPSGQRDADLFKHLEITHQTLVELGKHELKLTATVNTPFLNYMQRFDRVASVPKPFMIAGISLKKAEYEQVLTEMNTAQLDMNLHPVHLQMPQVDQLNDLNSVIYKKSLLTLRGLTQSGQAVNALPAPINITVYTTEGLFFSKDAAALQNLAVTPVRKTNVGNLKFDITPELLAALSNLGVEKQNMLDEMFKLPTFLKFANKIAAATRGTTIKFMHEHTGGLTNATCRPKYAQRPAPNIPPPTIEIRIDPDFLISSSFVSIVTAILHEMLHGFVDYEVIMILGVMTYTKPQIDKLKAASNANGKIYADLYCKFGKDDGPPLDPANPSPHTLHERSYSHNYMASFTRLDIENSGREYEVNSNITRNDESVLVKDIFSSPPDDKIPFTITKDLVYTALSWAGIDRTREYRDQADNTAASKQLFQLYRVVAAHEENGTDYDLPPQSNSVADLPETFLAVPNPGPGFCP